MSLYNMLFGMNSLSPLLLAVVGLRECDVERFRNVFVSDDGKHIEIYARTGGGNRDDYPQSKVCGSPLYADDIDDDFDSTYATFRLRIPEQYIKDVARLCEGTLKHGMRKHFARHLAKTLLREPTEADKERAAYDAEQAVLARTDHFLANGHTFVPKSDSAMRTALEIAEKNGGRLRTAWGILPLKIRIKTATFPATRQVERVALNYEWETDTEYLKHCSEVFGNEFPVTMEAVVEGAQRYIKSQS